MNQPLQVLYQIACISKQAISKAISQKKDFDIKLSELIVEVDLLRAEHPGCGIEKMYNTLEPDWLGRDKFVEIFMGLGYRVKRMKNYIRTTMAGPYYYPNLIKGLIVYEKNQLWQTDITYYLVGARYYYVCFILDVYTREIIGYNVAENLRAESNIKALKMAFNANKESNLSSLIHHSDRGSQYMSNDYTRLLAMKGIYISMGEKAQENAYAERINGTIKNEYLKYWEIETYKELTKAIKKAVNHYNKKRTHKSLPKKNTPGEFARKLVSLNDQKRPKVIVYTEGNYKIQEASSLLDFRPEKGPLVHVCPIVIND